MLRGNLFNFSSTSEIFESLKLQVFESLKLRRKHRYIIYKIGDSSIEVETIGARAETFQDFKTKLPYTDCRYGIFDQEYRTYDGRPASKIWFVSWLPVNSNPYNKMAYTSAKARFRESLPGVFDVQASRYSLLLLFLMYSSNNNSKINGSIEEIDIALGLGAEEEEDNEFDD